MRRTIIYSFSLLFLWLLLAQCFLMKNRWNDNKAYRIFKAKNVPLTIYDTIINKRHLHYAATAILYQHWSLFMEAREAG